MTVFALTSTTYRILHYLVFLVGPLGGHLGAPWGHLGAILGPSWAILGPPCALLEPLWGHLGAILGHLGATLRPPGTSLGPPWATLRGAGALLGHLGARLGHLGGILRYLVANLAHLGAILGHLGAILGRLGAFLALFGGFSGGAGPQRTLILNLMFYLSFSSLPNPRTHLASKAQALEKPRRGREALTIRPHSVRSCRDRSESNHETFQKGSTGVQSRRGRIGSNPLSDPQTFIN